MSIADVIADVRVFRENKIKKRNYKDFIISRNNERKKIQKRNHVQEQGGYNVKTVSVA